MKHVDPRAGARALTFAAIAFIVGPALFLFANLVVQLGWSTPFSWADNNISDLGNIHCQVFDEDNPRYVCSPLHAVMNTSAVLNGGLLIAGVAGSGQLWRHSRSTRIGRAFLMAGAGGFVLAGLAPADVNLNLHVLGAFLIMGMGNVGLLLAGFASRTSPLGTLRGLTLVVVAVAVVATWMHFSRSYGPLGAGGSERFALFTLQLWFIAGGAHRPVARKRRRASGAPRRA